MLKFHQINTADNAKVVWANSDAIAADSNILNTSDLNLFYEINHPLRQKEFLATRWLLKQVEPDTYIRYNKRGKPYLNIEKEISISHSKNMVALAITSNHLCGIDVQEINDKAVRLRERFLNDEEKQLALPEDELKNSLLWAAKETLFKLMDCENVPFKSCLHILKISDSTIETQINHPDFSGNFTLNYTIFDTFVMVYYV